MVRAFDTMGKLVHELRSATPLEQRRLTSAGRDSIPDMAGIDRDELLGSNLYPCYGRPRAVGGGAVGARLRRPWPPLGAAPGACTRRRAIWSGG